MLDIRVGIVSGSGFAALDTITLNAMRLDSSGANVGPIRKDKKNSTYLLRQFRSTC